MRLFSCNNFFVFFPFHVVEFMVMHKRRVPHTNTRNAFISHQSDYLKTVLYHFLCNGWQKRNRRMCTRRRERQRKKPAHICIAYLWSVGRFIYHFFVFAINNRLLKIQRLLNLFAKSFQFIYIFQLPAEYRYETQPNQIHLNVENIRGWPACESASKKDEVKKKKNQRPTDRMCMNGEPNKQTNIFNTPENRLNSQFCFYDGS